MASIDISGAAARRAANVQQVTAANLVQDPLAASIKPLFVMFLNNYVLPNASSLPVATTPAVSSQDDSTPFYVRVAAAMTAESKTTLYVDYTHLAHFHEGLCDAIREHFYQLSPHLNGIVHQFIKQHQPAHAALQTEHRSAIAADAEAERFHAAFYHLPVVSSIRDLKTSKIGELMSISGTVTRTSAVRPELNLGTFRCADCKTVVTNIKQQFKYTEPNHCLNTTCENRQRWALDTSLSTFSDWQLVRIQENSHEIPAGSMPRSMKIVLRHDVVEQAKPGDKCVFTGSLIVVPDISQLGGTAVANARFKGAGGRGQKNEMGNGVMGLKELGVRDLTYSLCFLAHSVQTSHSAFGSVVTQTDVSTTLTPAGSTDADGNPVEETEDSFSQAEKDRIHEMKSLGKLYTRLVASIAPNIFGHDEIKRGILLMLFGGVHKRTSDGQNLRGDINVCIVGDPSTSKSQFLKYVCTFLPRAVYTSGKASSAAGLTASIARDPETGEFAIEAGALMLADNGICCIDEFDKMEPTDQVAIHEAMEQQTISIAKAGIQATLNARTSILAAANPIKGRYDPSRTLKQNVDISAPIMSRFDLFFVVLDEGDQAIDYNIARHIVNVHTGKAQATRTEFSMQDLQLYIRYARTKKPSISPEAKQYFVDNYCSLRGADSTGTNKSAYRITVRQLESMIRLAEARARLDLENEVTPSHVKEAARLLKKSIVHVENRDVELEDDEEDLLGLPDGEDNAMADVSAGGNDDDDNNGGGGGDEGGAGGPSGGDEKEERSATPSNKKGGAAAPKSGSSQAEGKEGEAAAAAASVAPARREVKLNFSEYQRITLLLVKYMRSRESADSMTTSWKDLVNYFISESLGASGAVSSESGVITSESELAERTRIVELVIHRLIKTDHILLMVKKSNDKSKRALQVHPNFTGEGEAIDHGAGDRAPPKEPKPAKGTIDAELMEKRQAEQLLQGMVSAEAEAAPARDEEEEEQKAQPMDEDDEAPATPVQKRGGSKAATPKRTPTAAAAATASQGSGRSARSSRK